MIRILLLLVALFVAQPIAAQVPSWVHVAGPPRSDVSALIATGDRFVEGTSGGHVLVSNDQGATWTLSRSAPFGARVTVIVEGSPSMLLLGTAGRGVYRSSDSGATWSPLAAIAANPHIVSIARDADGRIYAGGDSTAGSSSTVRGGIFRSTNDGASWTRLGLPADVPRVDAILPGTNAIVALGTTGIMRSTDDGVTWQHSGTGMPVDMRPTSGVVRGDGRMFVATEAGMHRSDDDGGTWSRVPGVPGSIALHTVARNASGRMMLASNRSGSIYISSDDGETWTALSSQPGMDQPLTASAATSGAVARGYSGRGILRSLDAGSTWSQIEPTIVGLDASSVFFPTIRTIVAVASDWRLRRSTDNGVTWSVTTESIPFGSIGVMPNGDLLAGGVRSIRSTDDGATWSDPFLIPPELFGPSVGRYAFGIVPTRGLVYRSSDNGVSWHDISAALPPGPIASIVWNRIAMLALKPDGLHVSKDYGNTWTPSATTIDGATVRAIAADGNSATLYAATSEGLFASFDQGATWGMLGNGFAGFDVTGIAVDRRDRIAVTTRNAGVWISEDFGSKWWRANVGLTTHDAVFVVPSPRGDLWLGTGSGLWRLPPTRSSHVDVVVSDMDFGHVRVIDDCSRPEDTVDAYLDVDVTNLGTDAVTIALLGPDGADAAAFSLDGSSRATTIPRGTLLEVGETRVQRIRFRPTREREYSTSLLLMPGDGTPVYRPLRGIGVETHAAAVDADLGTVAIEGMPVNRTVAVTSTGRRPWRIDSIELDDPQQAFALGMLPTMPFLLGAGDTLGITVAFDAPAEGAFTARLIVHGDHSLCGDSVATITAEAVVLASAGDDAAHGESLAITGWSASDGMTVDIDARTGGVVRVELVDIAGRTIALRDVEGAHGIVLHEGRLPAGPYVVRASSGSLVVHRRVIVAE